MSQMTRPFSLLLITGGVLLIGLTACAPEARLREDPEDFREEVAQLQREIAENPGDAAPLRDLGAIYVRTKRPAEGYQYLEKAFSRDSDDPKTLFYLGVANERLGREQTARNLYQRYPQVPDDSRFRTLMKGRYEWLLRREVEEQMARLVQQEDTLAQDIQDHLVAVLPFAYQGGDQQYAPLGRGLGEMISVDLAQIDELQLVERVRIEALLDELQLAQSEYVDPETAPRAGRILGAGRLIGGAYSILDGENLQIETALAEVRREGASSNVERHSDALEQLFQLEKEIVFGVVDRLGIQLSAEERQEIERVPTQNLQAFLAYSRGLEAQAQGNFEAAAEAFQRAHELDPNFSQAAEQQETAQAMSSAAGSIDQVLTAAVRGTLPPSTINLINSRQQILSQSIGAGVVPGQNERQPGAESGSVDGDVQILRDPPPPPEGQNR